jgi:hypothetical protein
MYAWKIVVALGGMSLTGHVAQAAEPATSSFSDSGVVDGKAKAFFDALKTGKSADAIGKLMESPLWAQRTGVREAIAGQVDAAMRAYGPVLSYEKASTERLGTMVVRHFYLVQHRDMVTRWELDLVRTGTGWTFGYFAFTDQVNNWFN